MLTIKEVLTDANLNKEVQFIAGIKQVSFAFTQSNQKYASVTLIDKSGKVEAKKWEIHPDDESKLQEGEIYLFKGILTKYKQSYQLKLDDYTREGVDLNSIDSIFDSSRSPLSSLEKELDKLIKMIKDDQIQTCVKNLIKKNYDKYTSFPAAVSVHHAYKSGLLYHSVSVCKLGLKIAENYHEFDIDQDYIIAGCLLHDLGKTVELTGIKASSYSVEGNLVGHISLSYAMFYQEAKALNMDDEKINILSNIILSHHGKLEYGSPVLCATLEALIVHYADEIDSKMEILYQPYQNATPGGMTDKIATMDKKPFYVRKKK